MYLYTLLYLSGVMFSDHQLSSGPGFFFCRLLQNTVFQILNPPFKRLDIRYPFPRCKGEVALIDYLVHF